MLFIDLETRSEVNLLTAGAYNYARDPSTEVLCMCYAFDDGLVEEWDPSRLFPAEVITYIGNDGMLAAHNAQFERLIFEYVLCNDFDFPSPSPEQWVCTATLARGHALPGKLDHCARALGLRHQKSLRGDALIRLMCIPPFEHTPALLAEMITYCRQDVEVEREIHDSLSELPNFVWDWYDVSERINDRGLLVDVELALAAVDYSAGEQEDILEELNQLIGYGIKPRSPKIAVLVHEALPNEYKHLVEDKTKKAGLTMAADRVTALLEVTDLDPKLTRIIELKALASKSSVAKFGAMAALADEDDDRVRGAYIFMGAGQTGRFSSRGLQVHNLPRICAKDPDTTRHQIMSGRLEHNVLKALSSMLRPSIIAETGKTFVCGDWRAVEARALPWLTGKAEHMLDIFRQGRDVYVETAEDIYPGEIGPDERQIGKVVVLSLGYGGAVGAFQSMARNYGVHLEDDVVQGIVNKWRAANPWAKDFWKALEKAIMKAFNHPGMAYEVGRVTYAMRGEHMYCRLPSGRELMYPFVKKALTEGRYGGHFELSCIKSSLVPAKGNPWPRMSLWGGLLAENITQAFCADLLMDCLARVEDRCSDTVGHTHDEVLQEVEIARSGEALALLEEDMLTCPVWAEGLPLDVELWSGPRYRK